MPTDAMNPLVLLYRALLLVLAASAVRAQDVIIQNPAWYSNEPAPDTLPQPKSKLRPDYPDELRQTSEIGYVIVARYVDAKGTSRSLWATGTHLPFQRAVEQEFQGWDFTPGKSAGQTVNGAVWMAAIFNPKSSGPKPADATPRLLAVRPALLARPPNPAAVPTKITLDETGAVTDASPEINVKPAVRHAIEEAVQAWRFAPARQGGHAVATEIVLPVLCLPLATPEAGPHVPPKPVKRSPPVYPFTMRRYGIGGEVIVDFVVDLDGSVRNPTVHSSKNPAFDEAALDSVRAWTFEPGTRNGHPVRTAMRVPIVFQMEGSIDQFFHIEGGDQSKLPENLRSDTPPKFQNIQIPVYPYALRKDDVSGKAQVAMWIGTSGRVVRVDIISADKPEFGLALAAAAEGFVFDPALKAGKPVPYALKLDQSFSSFELRDDTSDDLLRLEKKHPERIVGGGKLDAPLKPISRRAPVFPVGVAENTTTGNAVIECLIDENGHARLPRIVSASEPAFGYAAMQAANAWWFERPTVGGKPAVARVQIPFSFSLKTTKPAKPAAKEGNAAGPGSASVP